MLEKAERDAIARKLRAAYEERPKGPMPARLWQLLLQLEEGERRRNAPAARA